MKPAIIVPAFARHKSLRRLLNSITNAVYPSADIEVIVSLDGGCTPQVQHVAEEFKERFVFGNVRVVKHVRNMGLREHIIWCGDHSQVYGSVIVLEDDLVVHPDFYCFAVAALKFYAEDPAV